MSHLPFEERIQYCKNPVAKKLLQLMAEKQTNLCLSADVTHRSQLLTLADKLGPEICILKTHIDIIEDFDQELTKQLQTLAKQHDFLIFEDRKFADIGNTVKHQYQNGIYHIADWADIINAHITPGPGIIEGLKSVGLNKHRALLLLAEMSSAGTLATGEKYIQQNLTLAEQHDDFTIGFISQHKISSNPGFIYLTPGVNLKTQQDNLGQSYNTPEQIIFEQGSDIIIVGRGIFQQTDPLTTAKLYRQQAWESYLQRLKK